MRSIQGISGDFAYSEQLAQTGLKVLHDYLFCDAKHYGIKPFFLNKLYICSVHYYGKSIA